MHGYGRSSVTLGPAELVPFPAPALAVLPISSFYHVALPALHAEDSVWSLLAHASRILDTSVIETSRYDPFILPSNSYIMSFQRWLRRQQESPLAQHAESMAGSEPPGTAKVPFPDGIEVFHDCRDAEVDIFFVHGLSGNRRSTWTAEGKSDPWPQTLLAPKLARARILTYGYDAYIVRKSVAGNNSLLDHATNLVIDLTEQRRSTHSRSRPIVFVAHSLGGLVCKKAILLSKTSPESHLRDIFDSVRGIAFLGTPHRGSTLAGWADIPATLLGVVKSTNNTLLALLKINGEILQDTHRQFLAMIREQHGSGRRLEVTCFSEELPLRGVGFVVDKGSATMEGYTAATIHGNHMNMVKFASDQENGFKRLLGEIQRWVEPIHVESSESQDRRDDNCYIPQKHSSIHFVGRSELIDRMTAYFRPRGGTERSGRREFIIYGPGGFGKTQLCLSFWRVYWIDASTKASLAEGFHTILNDPECREFGPDPIKVASRWLYKQRQEWLVVLDNADDEDHLHNELNLGGNCSNILITTRNARLRRRVPPHAVIAIGTLSVNDAKQLLWTAGVCHTYKQRTTEVESHLTAIAETLHGVPLALQHAASAILSDYYHPDHKGDVGYHHTLYSAWSLSIDFLEKKSRRELSNLGQDPEANTLYMCPAVELLSLFSFFHHSMISKTIFHRAATHTAENSVSRDNDGLPTSTLDLPTHFVKLTRGIWDSDLFRRSIQALQGHR
ncbi:hypothetical protein ACCO45_007892 [Purpureocillium lilacinum]|uniref:Uncharacterized protein n=1 Tax=Purpureocillium lilacinum TaxID=33203 RepID=A0ACC4DP69_PURLI